MRALTLILAVAIAVTFLRAVDGVDAAPDIPSQPAPAVSYQEIDDNDDTLVEVQLAVVVIVFGMVFVVGSLLYLLRRRLGLVAPPPDQAAIEDHH